MPGHRTSISVRQLARCMAEARKEGERPFATFTRYSNDPEFAARHDADRADWQRQTHALIDDAMSRARETRNFKQEN